MYYPHAQSSKYKQKLGQSMLKCVETVYRHVSEQTPEMYDTVEHELHGPKIFGGFILKAVTNISLRMCISQLVWYLKAGFESFLLKEKKTEPQQH